MSNSMTFHINSNLFRTVQHLSLFDCKENMEKRKPFISYNLAKQLQSSGLDAAQGYNMAMMTKSTLEAEKSDERFKKVHLYM